MYCEPFAWSQAASPKMVSSEMVAIEPSGDFSQWLPPLGDKNERKTWQIMECRV